jgi:3-hydroxymyristoyl/3-hydroxydecanoyl-(acyl carrier protein) dehydratase
VRLPDEPLMLVDRIVAIEGTKGILGPGAIVTEHDVRPGAWYLDGGKAPVCISVEAGQADLFLCAYLGIDLKVKGQRAYRLLDAVVEFHRSLPVPGETIRYEIAIHRFVKQGDTFLFFFSFEGFIGSTHLITMTDGCAGFFTEEEVKNSGGIILSEKDRLPEPGVGNPDWEPLIRFSRKSISDQNLNELRKGNPEAALGEAFQGLRIPESLRLPGGPMKLIDRILDIDPKGGRYGLGLIRAEADIHPDDWFLTCHFKDDRVMPGTLMYECCAHTLRVFLQQSGWISDLPGACYEPVIGVKSLLKCRGPVTPETRHVHYEVEIKDLGFGPEPYAIGDAHMFADGHRIVWFSNISLKLSKSSAEDLKGFWKKQPSGVQGQSENDKITSLPGPFFTREQLLEFALKSPSKAFGEPYRDFDSNRFIARLPNPPLLLMSRVNFCEPEPWILKPGGWIEAAYDVSENDWYFAADRSGAMPYVILLEIALQPCGWLAAYMGSALKSKKDLKFRNLDGNAVLHNPVLRKNTTLTTRARCTRVSTAGEMIIQQYDFLVLDNGRKIYEGNTTFGFFTAEAMAMQKGIARPENRMGSSTPVGIEGKPYCAFQPVSPFTPEDASAEGFERFGDAGLQMPGKALLMIDEIETYEPRGGDFGLGLIRGVKRVDPLEWFFKAHFYQDPVCPGSLGIESFLQVLKFAAMERWGRNASRSRFEITPESEHTWSYRGQILPENKKVDVEAVITNIQEDPWPMIRANGWLKVDGKTIYEMKNYSLRMVSD